MELEILYEDEDVLVCYKPAGIATQTAKLTEPDMVSTIRNYRVEKGESDYVGIIHRLDQPVEGVLVFAKNAADGWKEQVLSQVGRVLHGK